MWDVVLESLLDTLKLFPFLFLMYVLIEALEHNTAVGGPHRALSGKCAPLIGAATGLVPLCGFSVMAAKLYEHRHVTMGTLFAVFIATSDEALLVMLLSDMPWAEKGISILALCAIKFALGMAVGYLVDLIARDAKDRTVPLKERRHAHGGHDHVHAQEGERIAGPEHVCGEEGATATQPGAHDGSGEDGENYSACEHHRESKVQLYLVSPLLHSLQVAAFILLVNLAFGFLFERVGEERVIDFLRAGYWYQPLVAGLIGLVPNCASSVVLAETYAVGGIAFGSCLAGLIVNAGLGYLVLYRRASRWKQSLLFTLAMFVVGIAAGYAVNAIALAL